jgi:hypothetical protein
MSKTRMEGTVLEEEGHTQKGFGKSSPFFGSRCAKEGLSKYREEFLLRRVA